MNFTIEPATAGMAEAASKLLRKTMGKVGDHILGRDDPRRAQSLLRRLFQKPGHLFSYECAATATTGGEMRGLVLGYPAGRMWMREVRTAQAILAEAGITQFLQTVLRSRHFFGVEQTENGAYFIAHLAVLPEWEGQGIGRELLRHAEQSAHDAGFHKTSLTVDFDNARALELYTRAGFRIVGEATFPALERILGFRGFHRMAKEST